MEMDSREFRKNAFAFREQAEQIGRQAKAGVISARKAAREQIKAARRRAKDMRNRASARRHRAVGGPRTSASAVIIGVLSVLFLGGILTTTFLARSANSSVNRSAFVARDGGRPVILAVDSDVPLNDSLRAQIRRIADDYRRRGYSVIEDAQATVASVLPALRAWKSDPSHDADTAIEDYLEREYAYGIVHVEVSKSKKSGRGVVQSPLFVYSTRPGAEHRRVIPDSEIPDPPSSPYLLINDHPIRVHGFAAKEIDRHVKAYRDKGWNLVVDDDLEVKVRPFMPFGPIEPDQFILPALHAALAQANLGGVLRVDGTPGIGPENMTVTFSRIDRDPTVPAPSVPDAPAVVEPPSAPVVP